MGEDVEMAALGNIIWFIFFGWWNALLDVLAGLLFSITVVGIPIGKSLFQYAKLMALPFGKVIVKETDIKGCRIRKGAACQGHNDQSYRNHWGIAGVHQHIFTVYQRG